MKKDRTQQIEKARNVNELLSIVSDIEKEIKSGTHNVDNLIQSLSSSRPRRRAKLRIMATSNGEVTFDYSKERQPVAVTRIAGAGTSLKLSKFVPPKMEEVRKNNEILSRLYDNTQDLDAVEAALNNQFFNASKRKEALAAVQELKASAQAQIDRALQALQSIADKHVPTEFKMGCNYTYEFIKSTLDPTRYESLSPSLYVAQKEKDLLFCYYLKIINLKDSKGFVYKDYYVLLTGLVNETGVMTLYCNVAPNFRAPGDYSIGKVVTTRDSFEKRLRMLLSANDIVTSITRRPYPVSETKTRAHVRHIKGVESVSVKDDRISIRLDPKITPEGINRVTTEVIPVLNYLAGISSSSKSIFKHKVERRGIAGVPGGPKVPYLTFVLAPKEKMQDVNLSTESLVMLKDALGMTDTDVNAVREALRRKL